MFVLNQIDLGHLPVSVLLTWDEINVLCGPVMLMAARGCIPKMWSDIAHMLGWWNDRADPAATARAWFRDHPDQKAALDDLRRKGKMVNPFTGIETTFRRGLLGTVGKNWRYVWLASSLSPDDARRLLGDGRERAGTM